MVRASGYCWEHVDQPAGSSLLYPNEKLTILAITFHPSQPFLARHRTLFLCGATVVFWACALAPGRLIAQTAPASPASPGQAQEPARRPSRTATGFVDAGPKIFENIAAQTGLAAWNHTMGAADKALISDVNGSGVGLVDYDNDGWLDIYLVNG